jgi:hypothetical protein
MTDCIAELEAGRIIREPAVPERQLHDRIAAVVA